MGFMDEYNKALQEIQSNKGSSGGTKSSGGSGSFMDNYRTELQKLEREGKYSSPYQTMNASSRVASRIKTKKKKKEEDKWFRKGVFEDGYDFGDISKAIIGSVSDVAENIGTGILGMGEKAVDALAYLAPAAQNAQFYQNGGVYDLELQKEHEKAVEQSKKDLSKFIAKDLYDEEKIAKIIISDNYEKLYGHSVEEDSVFAAKSDALIQSGGQLLGTAALSSVGLPWWLTTGATSFGSEAEKAMKQGATYEQAGASAAISAGAEILSEKLSGGISFGGKTLDDTLTKQLARGISNKMGRTFAKLGMDMAGEGAEEVFSQVASNIGSSLYKEESIKDLLFSEEAFDEYLESFIGGAALGGVAGGFNAVKSNSKGVDYASGLSKNEQAVVEKLYKDEVASREKEGKVTQKEKSEIYDSILEDMEKGYISTDTIEEVLGGDTYSAYKNTVDSEDAILKEYEELGEKPNATPKDYARYTELTEKVKDIHKNSQRKALKSKLNDDVMGLVKGSRLAESYNQRYQSGQKYEADLTQYDTKQQAVVQKAIDSGILNNSRRTHEFVDFVSKISADTGVSFDFSNTAKLKEAGYVMEGQTIDGFYNPKEGITVNIDSPKSRQFVVGHEITHALEGTELYDALRQSVFDYAKMKNQYGVRMESIQKRYKEGTDFEAELTADLVGEYIFSDTDFINNLSTQNRNVFQKVFDEIKYLCKIATAGSKEARELEKVKRAFEKAYREGGKTQGDTKFSLSDSDGKQLTKEQQEYFKDSKARDENGNLVKVYHSSPTAGFTVFDGAEGKGNYKYGDYGDGITFFTDNKAMADSYSPSDEKVDTRKLNNLVEAQEWLVSIGQEFLEVRDENGSYDLYDNIEEEVLREFDSEEELLRELKRAVQEELGDINAGGQYEGYVDLKNPLVVDAEGRPWNRVTDEFSQEVYEKYQSLSTDEKSALTELTEWEDFSTFRNEILQAARNAENGGNYEENQVDYYSNLLASAYNTLKDKDGNVDFFNLFDVASDNFSDETVREKSVIQLSTNDYVRRALEAGTYDGVIIKNVIDYGGNAHATLSSPPGNDYIVFNSNQFKAADNLKPTADPDIRYSLSEVTEEQNQKGLDRKSEISFSLSNDTAYMDKAIAKNNSMMKVDSTVLEETKALRERIAGRMNAIKDRGLVGLPEDIEGNTYIANSSYDGTEENTTICPRSLASEAFVDAVSEYLGRPLSVNEQIYISQDLQGRSLTPECTYCYVATDRKAYRAFLGEYVAQRDAVLQKVQDNPNADVSRSGELYKQFLNGRKDTNPMYSRFKMWVDAYKNGKPMIDASHLANINKLMGDINSEFGAELKPQIVDAMKYAQSASWAKKRVNYVAYNGHILNWKQDRINKLNSHYGLRMYSFSDFHPAFVLENMQMITDASVRGLKMLGYTKDIDFVDIFAPSGMNINVSTFGFEAGGEVFENNLIGAEWEKAKTLREQYPNVGVTFVATNDTLVDWALNQEWIDVVIPYHLVRTGTEVAKAFNYTNYTSESSDMKTKDWKKSDKKYIAPTEHNNDKATYLAALEKNHLSPRFERFIDNPNYMKLVNECRQPASVSKPVQPVFNEDAAMVALAKLEANGYYQPIGGSVDRMYEIAGEVADAMTNQLAPAMSLSDVGEQHTSDSLSALRLDAPVAENSTVQQETQLPEENSTDVTAAEMQELFPDDAVTEQEELDQLIADRDLLYGALEIAIDRGSANDVGKLAEEYEALNARIKALESTESARTDSLTDADAPTEIDAPVYTDSENYNPYSGVTLDEITRSTRTYSDRNPGARQYIEEGALGFLYDVNNSTHGERWYNDDLYYASGGEQGFGGTSRSTTDDIAYLKDSYGYTWDQLQKAAEDVVKGEVRSAAAKRVEYLIHNRLMEGYTDVDGRRYEPNQSYITFLNNSFAESVANENSAGSFDNLLENADQYAPFEEVALLKPASTKLKDIFVDEAPIFEEKNGQTTMFAPEKKTTGGKTAKVLTNEPKTPRRRNKFWSLVKEYVLDNGMVFEDLSKKTGNREIEAKWNFIRYSRSRAQRLIGKGTDGVKALKDIKKEVDKSGKTERFYDYLYHKHNVDRMSLEDRFDTPNKAVFGDSVTSEKSQRQVDQYEKTNPEFMRWAEDVYGYMNHLRGLLVENGVISQETADLWEKMYPHYVPIRRAGQDGLNINVPLDTYKTTVNNPIKRATGGNQDILPLFDTMAERTAQTYRAIARNSFGIELKNQLGTVVDKNVETVDDVIDGIETDDALLSPGENGMNPTFTVFENGERVEFEITEEMYTALKPKNEAWQHRNKILNTASNVFRGLTTQYSIPFMATNAIKDAQDVLINSQHPVKTYANFPRAWTQQVFKGKYYQEYIENGGEDNSYFDNETKAFQEDGWFMKGVKLPLTVISEANNFIELTPRLAEYIASREAGRSVEVSMLDAARVTTNFAAGGDVTKFLNANGATFLNASVQGAIQQVRNIREAHHKGLMGYVGLATKFALAGLPAVLLNNMMWDDDEDYEDLADYVKQDYYIVAKYDDGKFIRIPKGRTVAVIQDAFEQVQNALTGNDEVDLAAFLQLAVNNLAPNNPLENNIIAPLWQAKTNKTWYGEDLIPSRLQDLPAAEQFDEKTDSFSKWLGEKTDISPYKINYVLNQYSGGVGDLILPMMTPRAESGDDSVLGTFTAPLRDKFTTDSVINSQVVTDYYDTKDALTVKANSSKASEDDMFREMYMDTVGYELSDLYKQKREIQNSDMSDSEKYEKSRELQQQIVERMKQSLNSYENINASGVYAEVGDKRYNKDAESGKWYEIKAKNSDGSDNWYYQKEQEVTKGLGISYEEYWNNREEYNFAYDKPGKYAIAKSVGGYDSYMEHYDVLENWQSDRYIAADKDANGNSISGSRKEKVIEYINGLDMDYGEKIILYRTQYSSKTDKNTYNMEIIDYLNSRDDISYSEMKSILEELGMEVDDKGNVTW